MEQIKYRDKLPRHKKILTHKRKIATLNAKY